MYEYNLLSGHNCGYLYSEERTTRDFLRMATEKPPCVIIDLTQFYITLILYCIQWTLFISEDVLSSRGHLAFTIALTTLLMPKSVSPEVICLYSLPYEDWVGTKLGNIQTCEAPGFFFVFGITTMFAYNSMLCLYYACTIAYQMKERNVRKYVKPILHLFPWTIGFSTAIPPLVKDLYNPSTLEAWCTPAPLCMDRRPTTDSVAPCIRGTSESCSDGGVIYSVSFSHYK